MSLDAIQGINPFIQSGGQVNPVGSVGGRQPGEVNPGGPNQRGDDLLARLGGINGELTPNLDKPGLRTLGFA